MDEFHEYYGRLFGFNVSIILKIITPRIVLLELIRAEQKGRGDGSKALVWLCELADKHRVSITGQMSPCDPEGEGLDWKELRSWYVKHGFTIDGLEMHRRPRRSVQEGTEYEKRRR